MVRRTDAEAGGNSAAVVFVSLAVGLLGAGLLAAGCGSSGVASTASSATAATTTTQNLGVSYAVGWAVNDVAAARTKLAAAMGIEFTPVQTSTKSFDLPGRGKRDLTWRETYSVAGGPFLDLVQVDPNVSPWDSSNNYARPFISYRVPNLGSAGSELQRAGMHLVASSGDQIAYWQGVGGWLVRLVSEDLYPATGGQNHSGAPIKLGQPRFNIWGACDIRGFTQQVDDVTGEAHTKTFHFPIQWVSPVRGARRTVLEFRIPKRLQPGSTPIEWNSRPRLAPYACTQNRTIMHLGWHFPRPPAAAAQWRAAGLTKQGTILYSGPSVTLRPIEYFTGPSGLVVEVFSLDPDSSHP